MVDARVTKNIASIESLNMLLLEIISMPERFFDNPDYLQALHSQRSLSEFSHATRGIVESSINTQKRLSYCIPGGYAALNDNRIRALKALSQLKLPKRKKTSKEEMSFKIRDLQDRNQILMEDLLILTFAFESALSIAHQIALISGNDTTIAKFKKEQRSLLDSISIRKVEVKNGIR